MPPRVGLVTALEREIKPLLGSFTRRRDPKAPFTVFERADVLVVCAGIGGKHAAAAASWLIASFKLEGVMSVGFAGALVADCKAGSVVTPEKVIDDDTGETFSVRLGNGVLVSTSGVLAEGEKRSLASRWQAVAADMEAAAVARVAQQNGVAFFAVKAITDEVDFAMPPMDRFVNEAGKFRNSELLAYAAVRPALWPALVKLGVNARLASSQLCGWLENQISRDFQDIWHEEPARP